MAERRRTPGNKEPENPKDEERSEKTMAQDIEAARKLWRRI